jgi:hypothetical protein
MTIRKQNIFGLEKQNIAEKVTLSKTGQRR